MLMGLMTFWKFDRGGISITDKDGNPSSKYVVEAPKPEELTDEELLGSNSAKVNDPVRMYLKRDWGSASLE